MKEIERESFGDLCGAGLPLRSQNGGTDVETTEVAGLRELGQEDCSSDGGG